MDVENAQLSAGLKIGAYEIIRILGQGGMGEVYLGRETALDRMVAIKVIRKEQLSDEASSRRFLTEGRALAKLNHPNIVTIYSIGDHDGLPYMAMEYVTGVPLDQYLEERVCGLRDVCRCFAQIAEGISFAHENGILHRDLKPDNVIVSGDGKLKIIDFGIAKLFGNADSEETTAGMMVGTPRYFAPEMLEGFSPSAQSDIYCLGVIFFEMLTGKTPFAGANVFESLDRIKNEVLRFSGSAEKLIPEKLQQLVLKMTEKKPSARYSTMAEVLRDFRAIDLTSVLCAELESETTKPVFAKTREVAQALLGRGYTRVEASLILGMTAKLRRDTPPSQSNAVLENLDSTLAPAANALEEIPLSLLEEAVTQYEIAKSNAQSSVRPAAKPEVRDQPKTPARRASRSSRGWKDPLLLVPLGWIFLCAVALLISENSELGNLDSGFLKTRVVPTLSRISATLTDLKFRIRGAESQKNKIVIVEVDSESLRTIGRWPWPRETVAFLMSKILKEAPKAFGVDIVFSEPERDPDPGKKTTALSTGDEKLTKVVQFYRDRVVLSWASDSICIPRLENCGAGDPGAITLPKGFEHYAMTTLGRLPSSQEALVPSSLSLLSSFPDLTRASLHQGAVNSSPDLDGVFRQTSLITLVGGFPHPSLSLAMASVGTGAQPRISFGPRHGLDSLELQQGIRLAANRKGFAATRYRGPARTFTTLSATDVFREGDLIQDDATGMLKGKSKHELLQNAYVLLGVTALAAGDVGPTPFDPLFPGVENIATSLDNILSSDFLYSGSEGRIPWILLFGMLVGGAAVLALLCRISLLTGSIAVALGILGLLFIDSRVLFANGVNWHSAFLYLELIGIATLTFLIKATRLEGEKS